MWVEKQKRASHLFRACARAASEVAAETLWPTRCAACGSLGNVLCESCRADLPYIDQWKACPVCGAPFGLLQCTECNTYSLKEHGRSHVPYTQCVSAVLFAGSSPAIARTRKDGGERRLAGPMAYAIACAIPPSWVTPGSIVTFVPSTRRAARERGFCHAHELALEVARYLALPCEKLLRVSDAADQRHLSRSQRMRNASGRFAALPSAQATRIILVDDVYTTGSTAMAAADALSSAGCTSVNVATFARVM